MIEFHGTAIPIPSDAPRLYDWNRAYFCPTCGSLWARWHLYPVQLWTVSHRACPSCGDGRLAVDLHYDLHLFPTPALLRELTLHFPELPPCPSE